MVNRILAFVCLLCIAGLVEVRAQGPPTVSHLIISQASIEATFAYSKHSKVNAEMHYVVHGRVFDDGWGGAPLFFSPAALKDLQAPAGFFVHGSGPVTVLSKKTGPFQLNFRIIPRVVENAAGYSWDLPLPAAGVVQIDLKISNAPENLLVTTFPQSVVEKKDTGHFAIIPPCAGKLRVQLRTPRKKVATDYRVYQQMHMQVAPELVTASVRTELKIIQGTIRELNFRVSPKYKCVGVLGKSIGNWKTLPRASSTAWTKVRVYWDEVLRESTRMEILLEKRNASDELLTAPRVVFGEARNVSGRISLEAPANFSLVAEATSKIRRGGQAGNALVYEFNHSDYRLQFSLTKNSLVFDAICHTRQQVAADASRVLSRVTIVPVSGKIRQCELAVPKGFVPIEVSGASLSNWSFAHNIFKFYFWGRAQGTHKLEIEGFMPLTERKVSLVAPYFAKARNNRGAMGISVEELYSPEVNGITGLIRSQPSRLPSWLAESSLAFTYAGKAPQGNLQLLAHKPDVHANAVSLVELTGANLVIETRVHFDVQRAPLFQYQLDVGSQGEVVDVSGTQVASYNRKNNTVRVFLLNPIMPGSSARKRQYRSEIRIIQTVPMPKTYTHLHFSLPVLLNTSRFRGFAIVRSRVDKNIIWRRHQGTTEVDPRQVPWFWLPTIKNDLGISYEKPGPLRLACRDITPVFTVKSTTTYTVSASQAQGQSRLELTIEKSSLDKLRIQLPKGSKNIQVLGPGIRQVEIAKELAIVELASRLRGKTVLQTRFTIILDNKAGTLNLLPALVEGARYHKGYLAYRNTHEIQLSEGYGARKHLSAAKRVTQGALAAFPNIYRFANAARPQLRLLISKVTRQETTQAQVIECRYFTRMQTGGEMVTEVHLVIENRGRKQFLRLELPKGGKMWGAFVQDKPVKAGYGTNNSLLIPLLEHTSGKKALLKVRIQYRQPLATDIANVALTAPKLDIPVRDVKWAVDIPRGYRIIKSDGNMDLVHKPALKSVAVGALLAKALEGGWDFFGPYLREIWEIGMLILAPILILLAIIVVGIASYRFFPAILILVDRLWQAFLRILLRQSYSWARVFLVTLVISAIAISLLLPSLSSVQEKGSAPRSEKSYHQETIVEEEVDIPAKELARQTRDQSIKIPQSSTPLPPAPALPNDKNSDYSRFRKAKKKPARSQTEYRGRRHAPSDENMFNERSVEQQRHTHKLALQRKRKLAEQQKREQEKQRQKLQKQARLASRYFRQGKFKEAQKLYEQQLDSSKYREQAQAALESIRKQQKSGKKKGASYEIDKIRKDYLDRALAQVAIGKQQPGAGLSNNEDQRLIKEKLVEAENRLLQLPDSSERRRALNDIAFANSQIQGQDKQKRETSKTSKKIHVYKNGKSDAAKPKPVIQKYNQLAQDSKSQTTMDAVPRTEEQPELEPEIVFGEELADFENAGETSSMPTPKPEPSLSIREEAKKIEAKPEPDAPNTQLASKRRQQVYSLDQLRAKTHRRGDPIADIRQQLERHNLGDTRLIRYGRKLVVIGTLHAQNVVKDFIEAQQQQLAGGKSQQGVATPKSEDLEKDQRQKIFSQRMALKNQGLSSVVREGRARGALPLLVTMPKGQQVYRFRKVLSANTVPQLALKCSAIGTSASLYFFAALTIVLVFRLCIFAFRRA